MIARVVVVTLPFLRMIVMAVVEVQVVFCEARKSMGTAGSEMYGVDVRGTVKQSTR